MKLREVILQTRNFPYFTESIFRSFNSHLPTLRNQLTRWVKAGRLLRLKKGLYSLPDDERKVGLSQRLASNMLLAPSYVSLEFMLSHYGLIPERVKEITAITSHKTSKFANPIGIFYYRHIKKGAFSGFTSLNDEFGYPVLVATPEKALLDKIYLDAKGDITQQYLEQDLRLQNTKILRTIFLKDLANLFRSRKIENAIGAIIKYRKMELA